MATTFLEFVLYCEGSVRLVVRKDDNGTFHTELSLARAFTGSHVFVGQTVSVELTSSELFALRGAIDIALNRMNNPIL